MMLNESGNLFFPCVADQYSRGAFFKLGPDRIRNGYLGHRGRPDHHIGDVGIGNELAIPVAIELQVQGERRVADPPGTNPRFQHIIKPGGRFPVHREAYHLDVQILVQQVLVITEHGPYVFVDGNVHEVCVTGIEDDALGVALAVADPEAEFEGGLLRH